MPYYHTLGKIPRKRHTQFRRESGQLQPEHLMGALGFSGPASLLYHYSDPTRILSTAKLADARVEADADQTLRMRHFHLADIKPVKSPTLDRTPVLFNADVTLSIVQPTETDDFYYRNGQADEVVYISNGEGTLESEFGSLEYHSGDYVVVPRGILHRFRLADGPVRMLIIETPSYIRFPSRYLTQEGQLMEHAPFCERDIRTPETLETVEQSGEFRIVVKQQDMLNDIVLDHHPLNVVGWDGCYYPWAMSIHDFEPITGSLHQPPPVHQTFQADQFVICSFTPRLFDYHPDAVAVPYNHSNVMSDEVLYYANDEFMSRKGIRYGSMTLHPGGIPHGPHPGKVEAALGQKETKELAVMLDTFRPLKIAAAAKDVEDPDYGRSWVDG